MNPEPRGSFFSRLAGRLSRETSSGRFIPQIDGLRFVAIAMVVLYHLDGYFAVKSTFYHFQKQGHGGPDLLGSLAARGYSGVELFFAISGFILALPFAAHYLNRAPKVSLKKYYLRRITRLEPPYLFAVLSFFTLGVFLQGKPLVSYGQHLLASLFYQHNLIYGQMSTVTCVAWSLEVEVQFYLLVPLLASVFMIRRRWLRRTVLCLLILGALIAQLSWAGHVSRVSLSIFNFLQFFLVGFLLADIYQDEWKSNPGTSFYWDVIAIIGWPALCFVLLSPVLWHWVFPAMTLVLYAAAFRGTLCSRLFSLRWITLIGGMCYSIYLIHYQVISVVARFTLRLGEGLPYWVYLSIQMAIIGAAVLLVCGTYFVLIEKPCMRRDWPQRLMQHIKAIFGLSAKDPAIVADEISVSDPQELVQAS